MLNFVMILGAMHIELRLISIMVLGAMHIELRLISIMVLAEQGFFFEKVEYLFLLNIEHYYLCVYLYNYHGYL